MFEQTDRIRDSVFPLVEVASNAEGSVAFGGLLGTGFMIGMRGYALTARHVLDGAPDARALFVAVDGTWTAVPLVSTELHDVEDVAVIRLTGDGWGSTLTSVRPTSERHSPISVGVIRMTCSMR